MSSTLVTSYVCALRHILRLLSGGAVCLFFTGAAYSQSQERVRGLSPLSAAQDVDARTAFFTCSSDECADADDYVSCDTDQAILCLTDIDAPAPAYLEDAQNWTGAVTALTDPVAANTFKTIGDANDYCAANFGENWRVADINDGSGNALRAYGHPGDVEGRLWVDNKKQTNTTCWDR